MSRTDFLEELDTILSLPKGRLTGDEELASLAEWDSLVVVTFLALVDEKFQMPLEVKRVEACKTVNDLVDLVGSKLV